MKRFVGVLMIAVLAAILAFCATAAAAPSGKLIIFHAGSLTVPFAEMEKSSKRDTRRWMCSGKRAAARKWPG